MDAFLFTIGVMTMILMFLLLSAPAALVVDNCSIKGNRFVTAVAVINLLAWEAMLGFVTYKIICSMWADLIVG